MKRQINENPERNPKKTRLEIKGEGDKEEKHSLSSSSVQRLIYKRQLQMKPNRNLNN